MEVTSFAIDGRVLSLKELSIDKTTRVKLNEDKSINDKEEKQNYSSGWADNPNQEEILKNEIDKQKKELIKYGKEFNKEKAVVISENGEFLISKIGGKSNVYIEGNLLNTLKSKPDRSIIFMHNHPSNSTFSVDDLKVMSKYKSIKEIRAIGHNGSEFIMTLKYDSERPSNESIDKVIERIYNNKYKDIMQDYTNKIVKKLFQKVLTRKCFIGMNEISY